MSVYEAGLGTRYAAVKDWRREGVFPALLDRLAALGPKTRLLDYGGGDGRFALLCAQLPVAEIVTYDVSEEMTNIATRLARGQERVTVANRLPKERGFDAVTCNAVWMSWRTEHECGRYLSEIARSLKPGGLFLASVTHPCFRDQTFSTFRTDFDLHNYFDDGIEFTVVMHDENTRVEVKDTHWTLGTMAKQLKESGFALTEVIELGDRPDSSAKGSPWLILEAQLR